MTVFVYADPIVECHVSDVFELGFCGALPIVEVGRLGLSDQSLQSGTSFVSQIVTSLIAKGIPLLFEAHL